MLLVLIVDDSADTAESEAELLSLLGHRVQIARCGKDALRCVTAERPDVVLLDIQMPGADGFAVAQMIRDRCSGGGKQPLIVAVTACDTDGDRLRSADAGFDLHLLKPVNPAVLTGLLERIQHLLVPPTPTVDLEHDNEGSRSPLPLDREGTNFAAP